MLERLRQVAFMVRDLEEGRELYRRTLGMESCFSEDLSQYGLTNLVLPAGVGTFVELPQPTSAAPETPLYVFGPPTPCAPYGPRLFRVRPVVGERLLPAPAESGPKGRGIAAQ